MTIRISNVRRVSLALLTALGLLGSLTISCSKTESPTSPSMPAAKGLATISGTLVTSHPDGQTGVPLSGVTIRVASSGQATQADEYGRFTLNDVPAGTVSLQLTGVGVQSEITVNAAPGIVTRITVAVDRSHNTVTLQPRSRHGAVDSVNASAMTFVLKTGLGPVTVHTNASTVLRMGHSSATFADIRVGRQVDVDGASQADNSVLAARVDIEEGDEDEKTRTPTPTGGATTTTPTRTKRPEGVELEGTVTMLNGGSFTLLTEAGPATIQTNASTLFRMDDSPATLADVKVGSHVDVDGTRQADNSVLAARVDIEEPEGHEKTRTPTPTGGVTTTTPTPTGGATTTTPTPTPHREED
jgi:hypothetical protein